ncbi:unnamed protein product [Caretta caretta]
MVKGLHRHGAGFVATKLFCGLGEDSTAPCVCEDLQPWQEGGRSLRFHELTAESIALHPISDLKREPFSKRSLARSTVHFISLLPTSNHEI